MRLNIVVTCVFVILHGTATEQNEDDVRIAVIGGGIGGSSTAYYLRSLFGEKVKIDVYERERVGGRLANINIDGLEYEAGGVIIHPSNRYMSHFANMFGFEKIERQGGRMALVGTDGVVIETSSWSLATMAKFFWRYGFDMYNSLTFVKEIREKFERVYTLQEAGLAFTTVEELLNAADKSLVNLTRHSIHEVLVDRGFSHRFVDEVVMAALRTNYGQTPQVHAFVGAVCMAGMEEGLWSIKGGNYQVPEKLIKKSRATLISADVTQVILQKDSEDVTYEVQYTAGGKTDSREYNIVVIATPLNNAPDSRNIEFVGFPNVMPFSDYHRTIALFVQGVPKFSTFGFSSEESFPDSVLTTNETIFWNSYGKQSPVTNKKHLDRNSESGDLDNMVSKVFLNKVPTEGQVQSMFTTRKDLRLVNWWAYPHYTPTMELLPFVLYDQLYYVNAIESAASAMETAVIGGRNVANLVFNHWNNILDKVDEVNINTDRETDRQEL